MVDGDFEMAVALRCVARECRRAGEPSVQVSFQRRRVATVSFHPIRSSAENKLLYGACIVFCTYTYNNSHYLVLRTMHYYYTVNINQVTLWLAGGTTLWCTSCMIIIPTDLIIPSCD